MTNDDIAEVFLEMSELLRIDGGDPFRARAFERTAKKLQTLGRPVSEMLAAGSLERLHDIGEGSVTRIKDILRTGTCAEHKRLRQKLPPGVRALLAIKGIGARTARTVFQHLGIASVDQLEYAARTGQLIGLPGLPEQASADILRAIEIHKSQGHRVLLFDALRIGGEVIDALKSDPAVAALTQTGSARRRKATCGDLDVLVATTERGRIVETFAHLPMVEHVYIAGEGRASVRMAPGLQFDVRVIPPEQYGAGMHYFTGSQGHNIAMRLRANRRQLKISDHGIFRLPEEKRISPGPEENDIFRAVGLPFIPPELRENLGEIEAADAGTLPALVEPTSLVGDLRAMAGKSRAAIEDVVARARRLRLSHVFVGVDARDFAQRAEVVAFHDTLVQVQQHSPVQVKSTLLLTVDAAGALNRPDDWTEGFDWVVARFDQDVPDDDEVRTRALTAAADHGVIDAWAHLSDRHEGKSRAGTPSAQFFEAFLAAKLAVDVDGTYHRMDPDEGVVRSLVERGAKLAPASGESDEGLRFATYVARRGWATRARVLNTLDLEGLYRVTRRGEVPAAAAHVPVRNDIAEQLKAGVLSPALRDRIQKFMQGQPDHEVEAGLMQLSDNPLQAAFNLLMLTGSPQVLPEESSDIVDIEDDEEQPP